MSLRTLAVGVGLIAAALGPADVALSQSKPAGEPRPAVGGIASLPDAMLIYPARGTAGSCGQNCAEWLAAEGTVHWDGYKRMIAALDRFADRRRPVFLDVRGQSDLRAATVIGRILRERGMEVGVGRTIPERCQDQGESACVALKRAGGEPLTASLSSIDTCYLACALILAGGVRRTMPESTTVLIQATGIRNRLGLNISGEHREGLHGYFRDQFRIYLAQMGIDPQLADMIDANYGAGRDTKLSRAELVRLRLVTH